MAANIVGIRPGPRLREIHDLIGRLDYIDGEEAGEGPVTRSKIEFHFCLWLRAP